MNGWDNNIGDCVVSIIIPAYNASDTLERCLDSVEGQTFNEWEAIIINDGSTDCTAKTAEKYCNRDKRIRLITTVNLGTSQARNLGLDIANGLYILFLDADDELHPDCIWELYNYINKEQADVLLAGMTLTQCDGTKETLLPDRKIFESDLGFWEKIFYQQKANGLIGYVGNKLYRRTIIEKYNLRFTKYKQVQEDYDFILKFFTYSKKISVLSESLYIYNYIPKKRGKADVFSCIDNDLFLSKQLLDTGSETSQKTIQVLYEEIATKLYTVFYWVSSYQEAKQIASSLNLDERFQRIYLSASPIKRNVYRNIIIFFLEKGLISIAYFMVIVRRKISMKLHPKQKSTS